MLRKPNTIPSGDIIISDPVMEPFFITKSQTGGYVVYEKVVRGEKDNEYFKTISYPATFNHALKAVASEKLNAGETKHFTSIREYVQKWETIQTDFRTLTTIDQ